MLTDEQAEDIRRGLEGGTRGPVLIKWVRELLADRDERLKISREQKPKGPTPPSRSRERP